MSDQTKLTSGRSRLPCGRSQCLFDGLPERLVLEGYRHWMAGYKLRAIEPWELGWTMFAKALPPREARDMCGAVIGWTRACFQHARVPPQTFPFNCRRLCRHECIALSCISAQQHQDTEVLTFCLSHLVQDRGVAEAGTAAELLADTLTAQGHAMQPVSLTAIASVVHEPPGGHLH